MNEGNPVKRFFGIFFTVLATLIILFACVAFLNYPKPTLGWVVTKWETIVPFIVGTVFLISGLNLLSKN